ncbi:MAG: L,D-transpeptidase family protein [Syntrophobacterales bacterium]|nr:L,D-transpeptidase family protein [Syntrophobacterales bacterium]
MKAFIMKFLHTSSPAFGRLKTLLNSTDNHVNYLPTLLRLLLVFAIIFAVAIFDPKTISNPAALPEDKANEDLSRYEYPSIREIGWKGHFVRPQESLERLFGKDWLAIARFNRIDRRHVYPGMTIKVPENIDKIKDYTPMPAQYEKAKTHAKYILLDITEQWIGAYEYGRLVFSMPAATGMEGHLTPVGMFSINAYHRKHTSSLYKTDTGTQQYPMDYALLFHIDKENVLYWLHARDLPGRPASHGCVGLSDEDMQLRTYGVPEKPLINDAKKLYAWTIGEELFALDNGSAHPLADKALLEIFGDLPKKLPHTRSWEN